MPYSEEALVFRTIPVDNQVRLEWRLFFTLQKKQDLRWSCLWLH